MEKATKTNRVGKYLKSKREAAEMSLREAAKLAGMSHTHIMEIEDGKKSPAFDKGMNILKAYRADAQEFLRETATLGKMRKIPVVSWVQAGRWSETGESFHEEDAIEWIESDIKGEHNFALRVKGDSMKPEFNEGDIIIVVSPTAKAVPGDYVVAKNDEEEATFKQYKRYDNTKMLHPLNPKYKDIVRHKDQEYRIVGMVMEKKKRYK